MLYVTYRDQHLISLFVLSHTHTHTQMSHLDWVVVSQQLIVMSLSYSDCDRFGLVIVNIQATHEMK